MYEIDPSEASARKAVAASLEFGAYLRELLAERRKRPGDDLISALAAVVDDGDTLTETELIATCVLLLNAGHEASVNGAGNGWWTLLRHPDGARPAARRAGAHADRASRSCSASTRRRRCSNDGSSSRSRSPASSSRVAPRSRCCSGRRTATRRPSTGADDLDLARDPNPYISFGAGIHYCLGAPLAKLELGIAFETLLRRVPRLELVETPRWKPTFVLRGLEALRVRV